MNYEWDNVVSKNNDSREHTVLFSTPVGPIALKWVSNEIYRGGGKNG